MTTPGSPPPSRRQRAIDALKDLKSGEIITYEELAIAIGVSDVSNVHSAVSSARYRLALDYLKAVESVRGVGYRVVPENERVRLARTDQARAQGALKRGRRTAIYVDVRELSEEDRTTLERTAQSLSLQLDFARRMDVRQAGIEKALTTVPTPQAGARTASEQKRLLTRLEALQDGESPVPDTAPDPDDEPEQFPTREDAAGE